jgi:hypothetical protein
MSKIVGYYNMPTAGFGSADIPVSYFNTPTLDPFYPGWKNEPVPGWGAKPVMAGPNMVAVGSFGDPVADGGQVKRKIRVFKLPPVPAEASTAGMFSILTKPWFIALAVIGVGCTVYLVRKKL